MSIPFVVLLRNAAAQPPQSGITLIFGAGPPEGFSKLLDRKAVLAHQQVQIQPITSLGTQR